MPAALPEARVLRAALAVLSCASAVLLFVLQPMAAKWILPSYGGSASTWAACMLFFQTLLLAGYAYAHHGSQRLCASRQIGLHVAVLAGLFVWLLLGRAPAATSMDGAWSAPALAIAWRLWQRVGPAYFVLACTAPLLQRWATLCLPGEPYALYLWSNVGSFAALLAYPWCIEPALPVSAQLRVWSWGVALFALALAAAGAWVQRVATRLGTLAAPVAQRLPPLALSVRARWLAFSFVPSALLLSVTNQVTVDIAAMPLLWIVPLALYLLSFVVCFSRFGGQLHAWVLPLWLPSVLLLGWTAFAQGSAPLWAQLGAALSVLFGAALLCHGQLVAERPAPEQLTSFYLYLAWGGVLGGVFVSLLAPAIFSDYYEVELSTLGTFVLLLMAARSPRAAWRAPQRRLLQLGVGLCVPLLCASLYVRAQGATRTGSVVERRRSFLGPLRVIQFPVGRVLTHGRIRHGMQLSDPKLHMQPTMYFGPGTALARVLSAPAPAARRIGVVGLGVGTIAAYGRAGDSLRFYELDRNVLELAERDFSFLRESAAAISVQIGDGRLLLARQPAQRFDVLVLDAFSSDSVPVHLLTREAFALYVRHLAPDGILLANVSNRHLAVERVVRASAAAHGLVCRVVQTEADAERFVSRVRWAVMSRSAARVDALLAGMPQLTAAGDDVLWTDERASLLPILR